MNRFEISADQGPVSEPDFAEIMALVEKHFDDVEDLERRLGQTTIVMATHLELEDAGLQPFLARHLSASSADGLLGPDTFAYSVRPGMLQDADSGRILAMPSVASDKALFLSVTLTSDMLPAAALSRFEFNSIVLIETLGLELMPVPATHA